MDILSIVEPNPPVVVLEEFGFHAEDFEASYLLNIVTVFQALLLSVFHVSVIFEQVIIRLLTLVIIIYFFIFWTVFVDWCQKLDKYGLTTSCFSLCASL